MKERFSVIVLLYNQEMYLEKCLDSILAQDYKPLEVILCDDNSRDGSLVIAEKWFRKWGSRFEHYRIISHEKNLGIVRNQRTGIEASTGEYIKHLAADDILSPGALSKAADHFRSTGLYLFSSIIRSFQEDDSGRIYKIRTLSGEGMERLFAADAGTQLKMMLTRGFSIYAPSMFYRKGLYEKVDLTRYGFMHLNDYPSWILALKNNYKIGFMPEFTGFYRLSGSSVSRGSGKKMTRNAIKLRLDGIRMYKKLVLPEMSSLSLFQRIHLWRKYYSKRASLLMATRKPDPCWKMGAFFSVLFLKSCDVLNLKIELSRAMIELKGIIKRIIPISDEKVP
ncbi:MAG: glycosyltransferase family 2 protein [Synergistales bacterium]|nr:glycosyltransferase family 2 protein [Synergistales bacterium]